MNTATRRVILTPELVKELDVLSEMYWRWSVLPDDSPDDLVWQSSGSPLSHLSECIIGLLAESAPEGTDDALYFAGCVMQTFADCRPDSTMSQCRAMVVTAHAEQRAQDAVDAD